MDFYILMLGNLIGTASLAGWLVAWVQLDGRIKKPWRFRGQRFYNAVVFLAALAIGTYIVVAGTGGGHHLHPRLFVAAPPPPRLLPKPLPPPPEPPPTSPLPPP